jgi:hypothetical protein
VSEPWNFTEAQRRQFREAHAEAKRERMAEREHKCPRCHTPKLNRCRGEDGALLEHPHPERIKLVGQEVP